jgi:hypothetical protein
MTDYRLFDASERYEIERGCWLVRQNKLATGPQWEVVRRAPDQPISADTMAVHCRCHTQEVAIREMEELRGLACMEAALTGFNCQCGRNEP